MKELLTQLNNQDIKEQMFKMACVKLDKSKQKVYGWLFDELESRLNDQDFDYFLDQLDGQLSKRYAS